MADEITIVKAEEKHNDEIIKLIKESFITREPLAVGLGLVWEQDLVEFVTELQHGVLGQGYSFVALNASGRIVGCRLSAMLEIEKDQTPEPLFIDPGEKTQKMKTLGRIFQSLMSGWTKELPDSNVILEFVILCVEEEYGNQGIGHRLVDRSMKLAEELQVDYVYVIATNWKSQRLFDRLGFDTVRTRNYCEFIDDDGNPILDIKDASTCMKWMVKKIKNNS